MDEFALAAPSEVLRAAFGMVAMPQVVLFEAMKKKDAFAGRR